MTRHDRLVGFVERQGWVPGDLEPLAGDASNRRYSRLRRERLIIMDAPPQSGEDVRPFVAMTNWLRGIGYSAPEIVAADLEAGFLALEDLGDALFADLCARNAGSETELYENAVDLLADLSRAAVPTGFDVGGSRIDLARYDDTVLLREADLFLDWYLPGALGRPIDEALRSEFRTLVRDAIAPVQDASSVVVLRDYHAENLIWLPKRRGTARTGLLDYQDALAGHPAYDLVSLLEDARRDTGAELQGAMIRRYLDATAIDAPAFLHGYSVLGAQRNLKIVGIFSRLCMRDGKSRYPDLIPRVWNHLMTDLQHPALAGLRDWIADHAVSPEPHVLDAIRAQRRLIGKTA